MIGMCNKSDTARACAIINDAAEAYRGVVPDDRWHESYMPLEELEEEIADGIEFWEICGTPFSFAVSAFHASYSVGIFLTVPSDQTHPLQYPQILIFFSLCMSSQRRSVAEALDCERIID